jgi:hypothetical protein
MQETVLYQTQYRTRLQVSPDIIFQDNKLRINTKRMLYIFLYNIQDNGLKYSDKTVSNLC